jgi:hypothetical protein
MDNQNMQRVSEVDIGDSVRWCADAEHIRWRKRPVRAQYCHSVELRFSNADIPSANLPGLQRVALRLSAYGLCTSDPGRSSHDKDWPIADKWFWFISLLWPTQCGRVSP